ncbi:MAG: ABC transporter ATP-binding protein [Myxococcota bacterium]|nr:ABC transporter ATP-binding protein [Myxococcota bacterium]
MSDPKQNEPVEGPESREPVVEMDGVGIYFHLQSRRRISIKSLLLGGSFGQERKLLWALRDVSFKAYEGEILGVIGPNGAGKSTLCLALSEILLPDEGSVSVRGRVSTLLSLGAGFNRDLSGRDNILLNGAYLGMRREQIQSRVAEIVEFSELGDFIDQPVRFYSSGMRARLAFSIASCLEPEILILDEVLSVGDRAFQEKSRRRLEELMARSRLIVIVSHSSEFLRSICTHALWLERGRVRGYGSAKEILDAYEAAPPTGEAG